MHSEQSVAKQNPSSGEAKHVHSPWSHSHDPWPEQPQLRVQPVPQGTLVAYRLGPVPGSAVYKLADPVRRALRAGLWVVHTVREALGSIAGHGTVSTVPALVARRHHPRVLLAGGGGDSRLCEVGAIAPAQWRRICGLWLHPRPRGGGGGGGLFRGRGGGPTGPSHHSLSPCGSPYSPHDPRPLGPLPCYPLGRPGRWRNPTAGGLLAATGPGPGRQILLPAPGGHPAPGRASCTR